MNHAPLFAGINGFGEAADKFGWYQPFHCEIDEIFSKAYSKWRKESIKAYGNAIVPQVALQIFKIIQMMES